MLTRVVVLTIVVLTISDSGRAADAKDQLTFDGARAKQYVVNLSSDDMEGRASCTAKEYRKSADWVASKFKAWGLQPAGEDNTFFQIVSIRDFDERTGVPSLKVGPREFLLDDDDYTLHSASSAGASIQAEIVFVGYGISAAEKGLDEYAGVDVKGKIVLALKGTPKEAPEATKMFQRSETPEPEANKKEEEWKEESSDLRKITTAYEKGAAAILLHDPDSQETPSSRSRRGTTTGSFKPERKFLCFIIQERVFRAIMKREEQESPRGLKRRIDGLRRQIKEKHSQSHATGVRASLRGYDEVIRHNKEQANNTARNVLAKIEGTDPKLKNEYIFVGAHLDHLGVRDGYVYNGADDNASGSAVVMEVARVLAEAKHQPKRTFVFCCWCGEERGLLGSNHYTDKPCDGVTMDKVVACFNIDMVGMGEDLGAPGGLNFPSIWEIIARDQDPEIMEHVKPREGGTGGSDHSGFIKRGIETLALMSSGGGGHLDYHQPEDDAAKIEPEMLRITGQFVLQGMTNLANETKASLLIDRRQELYKGMQLRIRNYNPQLKDSEWTTVKIAEKDREALYDEIYDEARAMFRRGSSPNNSDSASRPKKSLSRGSADLAVAGDDSRLLRLLIDYHGIGRADMNGRDSKWVADGQLTDVGKTAIKTLEEDNVVVRLMSPKENLLADMLQAASKPFIITGDYQIPENLRASVNSRSVLLGIDLDPANVNAFLTRVESMKSQLGERKNLFAYLTSAEDLDKAKRPLYLGLIDRGWAHNEIYGTRDHGGLAGGATIVTLGK